jgi:hypothetical protein
VFRMWRVNWVRGMIGMIGIGSTTIRVVCHIHLLRQGCRYSPSIAWLFIDTIYFLVTVLQTICLAILSLACFNQKSDSVT